MNLRPRPRERIEINLTALIDVVFLLLIFFLVATRFDEQEKLISIRLAEILQAQPVADHATHLDAARVDSYFTCCRSSFEEPDGRYNDTTDRLPISTASRSSTPTSRP